MRLDQLKLVLSFIEEPDSAVVIQVPFRQDLRILQNMIAEFIGRPIKATLRQWYYPGNRVINFEIASYEMAGMCWNCPVILVERLDGLLPDDIEV